MMQYHPQQKPPRVSAGVIVARILAFGIMALDLVWVFVLLMIGTLAVAWPEPCRVSSNCRTEFWSALGIALLGALVALVIVQVALPFTWRSVWLALWSLVAVLVAYGTGLWAYRADW